LHEDLRSSIIEINDKTEKERLEKQAEKITVQEAEIENLKIQIGVYEDEAKKMKKRLDEAEKTLADKASHNIVQIYFS